MPDHDLSADTIKLENRDQGVAEFDNVASAMGFVGVPMNM